jgi:hypothetical protein
MIAPVVKCAKYSVIIALAAAVVIGFLKHDLAWAAGFLLGGIWSSVNFVVLAGVLNAIFMKEGAKSMTLLFAVKFPALYGIGFLLLKSGWFPAISLLAGLTFVLISVGGVLWLTLIRGCRN